MHGNPINHYDPNGQSVVHAVRGSYWVGGRVGAGINFGIRTLSGGLSLGSLLYDVLNDDASDDSDEGEDDENCEDDDDRVCNNMWNDLARLDRVIDNLQTLGEFATNKHNISQKIEEYNRLLDDYNLLCSGSASPPNDHQ